MATRTETANSIGLLILRVGMGALMLPSGYGKLQMLMDGKEFGDPIGLGPQLSLILVVAAEFLGSIGVMLGFATRLAAFGLAFTMGVAAFVAHANDPWLMGGPGNSKQPALMFLVPFLALVFTGAGMYSVDAYLFGRKGRGGK
jgi:putative oxidoreductase